MQDYFYELADHLNAQLKSDEVFTCSLYSEVSDFVRLNHASVRQAGSVTQHHLSIDLIEGARHAEAGLSLSGDPSFDRPQLERTLSALREQRAALFEDPHLLYATKVRSSERVQRGALPRSDDVALSILDAAKRRDLVGIYAAGEARSGFANSFGQRNWHATQSFNLDFSFHQAASDSDLGQAIKGGYAGVEWDPAALEAKFELAGEQLVALARPPRENPPGAQRVYLAPAALSDIIDVLTWGGFGLRDHRAKTTPLIALAEGEALLHESVSIRENTAEGIAADFQKQGFLRPPEVRLIEAGRYRDHLVSPRSAAEFGVPTNGANASETPLSIDVAAGSLEGDAVLRELGTGVYVSNLWYLNYSDRQACRTTGMTRFATFWIEKGKIVAPLSTMRFDESIYRMLGEKLVGLTREREMLLAADTYGRRSDSSKRLPGVLIDDFRFTL